MKRKPVLNSSAYLLLLVFATSIQANQPVSVNLPDSGSLQMSIPEDWKLQQHTDAGALNLRLTPAGKGDFMVLLTVMPLSADSPISSAGDLRKLVEETGKKQLSGALQRELELTEIQISDGSGYFYHITDRNPESGPGDYREGNQGMILTRGRLIAVTIFTHTGDAATVTRAFGALKTLRIGGNGQAAAEPDRIVVSELAETYEITVPVSRLAVVIPKGHFVRVSDASIGSIESRRYFQLKDTQRHIIVSGWFEPQEEFHGIEKFWAGETAAWTEHKLPLPETSEFKKIGNWDTVVYQMAQSSGSNPHIRAHWLQAGTWIDLHLSMESELSKKDSEQALETLLSQIRVSTKSGP